MRFMTLTTSKEKRYSRHKTGTDDNGKPIWELKERSVKDSFDILRQRIRRATVEKEGFTGFRLNKYYCLRTSEGNGVLHIIFWGGLYIPQNWLSQTWYKIHGAFKADIRFVHNITKTVNGLVGYLLDRYLVNQPIERMSYGWGWAWLGFCKSWEHIKWEYKSLRRGTGSLTGLKGAVKWEEGHSCRQALPFWKKVLWQPPITSRKTSFYTPNRGYNSKYFEV